MEGLPIPLLYHMGQPGVGAGDMYAAVINELPQLSTRDQEAKGLCVT